MRATATLLLLVSFLTTLAWADDDEKKDKKSKIPALTFVGNYDGEISHFDGNSDSLVLKIRDVVPQWVSNGNYYNNAPGRLGNLNNRLNQGGTYVPKEQIKDIPINLSPDVKVRLMVKLTKSDVGKKDEDGKKDESEENKKVTNTGKKKDKPLTAKELAEKDPDYKLGGTAGKKTDLAKGQIVRVAMGRNNDKINPQIYAMAIFVVKEGNPAPAKQP